MYLNLARVMRISMYHIHLNCIQRHINNKYHRIVKISFIFQN